MERTVTRAIMDNEKKKADKKVMLIVSFAMAAILWFIVCVFLNPDSTRTISGVPISMAAGAKTLEALGLDMVDDMSVSNVTVDVSGSRINVSALTATDFTVTPKFNAVSKAGTYTLELTVTLNNPDGNVEITSFSPKTVDITVARTDTVSLPITYTVDAVPEGYFLSSVTLADESLTITGPDSMVLLVKSAVVQVDSPANGTTSLPVLLLDAMGNEVVNTALTPSLTATDVTVSLLKTKELTLEATLTDLPAGVPVGIVNLSVSPATVTVAGPEEVIDTLSDTYSVADISLSSIGASETREFDLPLPGGVRTVDGVTAVDVQIDLSGSIIQSYLDITDFVLSDALLSYDVTVTTVRLRNVQIAGTADVVDAITAEDLIATVTYDGSQPLQSGIYYPMNVRITSDTISGFWVVGEYEVNVKVN